MMTGNDVRRFLMTAGVRADVADIVRGALAYERNPTEIAALVCEGISRMIRDEAERRDATNGGA